MEEWIEEERVGHLPSLTQLFGRNFNPHSLLISQLSSFRTILFELARAVLPLQVPRKLLHWRPNRCIIITIPRSFIIDKNISASQRPSVRDISDRAPDALRSSLPSCLPSFLSFYLLPSLLHVAHKRLLHAGCRCSATVAAQGEFEAQTTRHDSYAC